MLLINKIKIWVSNFLSYKKLIFLGFIFLFLYKAFFLLQFNLAQNPFILGDWLINYQDGGFKGRELSGSFFLCFRT